MTVDYEWRGDFARAEANELHAQAFATRRFGDDEWDWEDLTRRYSLEWVTARAKGRLVGFVNVVGDGLVHAWIQDVMVDVATRRQGVGRRLVDVAREGAREAGCEWLHVDFDEALASFYLDSCGFTPTRAGLYALQRETPSASLA
jgi:ribosomal protein S18 acetylase RimI-like enzyme